MCDLLVVFAVDSSTSLAMFDDTTSEERGGVVDDLAAKGRVVCWASCVLPLFLFLPRAGTSVKGAKSPLGWAVRDGASDGGEMVLGG
jgi:hypothetical protein